MSVRVCVLVGDENVSSSREIGECNLFSQLMCSTLLQGEGKVLHVPLEARIRRRQVWTDGFEAFGKDGRKG